MRRAPILSFVLAGALFLCLPGPAASASVGPPEAAVSRPGPIVSAEFELSAGHGLSAHFESVADEVALTIHGHHQFATYEVKGDVSTSSVVAQFGAQGQVSVTFTPTKTLGSRRPPKGCKGEAETEQAGVFSGTIEFTGEQEYVRLDATSAKGKMQVLPALHCSSSPSKKSPPPPDSVARRQTEKKNVATLAAANRRLQCYFIALARRSPNGQDHTLFIAGLNERRESMKIAHLAELTAPTSSFRFNHADGTASVRPPPPFSGSASFKRRRGKPPLWSGSLSVQLLGVEPIGFTDPGFRANLVPTFPGE